MSQTVIRSRKQPYVGSSVLLGPIIALGIYVGVERNASAFKGVLGLGLLLLLIFLYFGSLRLSFDGNSIVYREWWRTRTIPVDSVRSVERGPAYLARVPSRWTIHCSDGRLPVVINIANFHPNELRNFVEVLSKQNPAIRISV